MQPGTKSITSGKTAISIILIFAIAKIIIASGQQLSFDEAYYWTWSRHLDYWYYDQGPMIAWLLRLFTLASSTVITVKLVAIFCSSVFLYFGHRLMTEIADEQAGNYWLAIILSTPLYLVGGAISTYDAPMLMFWSAACYFGYGAVRTGRPALWLIAGSLSALGVLSKLPTLALPVGIFLTCLTSPDGRKRLASLYPWIAGAIALLPLLVLKLWDDNHGNLFTLHSASLSNRHTDAPLGRWTGDLIAGQLLIIGPTMLIGSIFALTRRRTPEGDLPRRYVRMLAVPLITVCLILSTKSKLEVNWPIAAYFTGLMPLAIFLRHSAKSRILIPILIIPGMIVSLFATFPNTLSLVGIRMKPSLAVKLYEPYGWDIVKYRLENPAADVIKRGGFVASTNYRMTAMTAWLLGKPTNVECLFAHTRNNQFVLGSKLDYREGQDALVVIDAVDIKDMEYLRPYFSSVTEISDPIVITSPAVDGPIRTIHLYECKNFNGYKIKNEAIGF